VERLRGEREEIPEDVRVLDVLGRVPLLGVDEVRELDGVTDEEDGRVVANLVATKHASAEPSQPVTNESSRRHLTQKMLLTIMSAISKGPGDQCGVLK
jgi:hypothetical protein